MFTDVFVQISTFFTVNIWFGPVSMECTIPLAWFINGLKSTKVCKSYKLLIVNNCVVVVFVDKVTLDCVFPC